MFNRSVRFARVQEASSRKLNKDERMFMESIPTFFVLVGLFIGILVAVVELVLGSSAIIEFIESISLDTLIGSLVWWLVFFFEILLTIIGLGNHHMNLELWGYEIWKIGEERSIGIIDWIRFFFTTIFEVVQQDAIVLFIAIGAIGISVAIVWIFVSETGIVAGIVSNVTRILRFVVTAPRTIYEKVNASYLSFNIVLSNIVIGKERLDNRNVAYHRKILLLTLGLGLYTFIGGIFVLATENIQDRVFLITVILIVLIVFGLGVGIIEMAVIARLLDKVSRGKYTLSQSPET